MAKYGASVFGGPGDPGTGSTGYRGDNLNKKWKSFAELSNNPSAQDFSALGKLKYGTRVRVTNPKTGKSIVLTKRDVGAGGGAVNGHKRGIDLWYKAAEYLGINGTGVVDLEVLSGKYAGRKATTGVGGGQQPVDGAGRAGAIRQLLLQSVQNPSAGTALTGSNIASAILNAEPETAQPQSSRKYGGAAAGSLASTTAKGVANFEGHQVAAWIKPALVYARKHGWKGQVNSGYRSYADQKRIYNSGVRPAAKPGTSNHEGTEFPRGAIDVSEAQQLSRILLKSPWARKLIYAGTKDPVHFSRPHNGSY